MSAPLDLDAICRRALDAATDEDAYFTRMGVLTDDIPALVAEVRRLRAEVSALADEKPGATGRALRAILDPDAQKREGAGGAVARGPAAG